MKPHTVFYSLDITAPINIAIFKAVGCKVHKDNHTDRQDLKPKSMQTNYIKRKANTQTASGAKTNTSHVRNSNAGW